MDFLFAGHRYWIGPPRNRVRKTLVREDAIAESGENVRRHVLDQIEGAELIVVDDGSRDRTGGTILDGLAAGDARTGVLHKSNGEHGSCVLAGLATARGDYVFLLDSDRQIPLEVDQVLLACLPPVARVP